MRAGLLRNRWRFQRNTQTDLRNIVNWGQEHLDHPELRTIRMPGASFTTCRYIKAGLQYRIRLREAEVEHRSAAGLPPKVVDSLRASIQPLRDLADSISQPPSDLLTELGLDAMPTDESTDISERDWDVFISHASEDKEFVHPFAEALQKAGLRVWYDKFTLKLGDSLRESINRGLARSRYGIVVLSPNFFAKHWTQQELNGLTALEVNGRKVILPLWHNIDEAGVRSHAPILADRLGASTKRPMADLVAEVLAVVRPILQNPGPNTPQAQATAKLVRTPDITISQSRGHGDNLQSIGGDSNSWFVLIRDLILVNHSERAEVVSLKLWWPLNTHSVTFSSQTVPPAKLGHISLLTGAENIPPRSSITGSLLFKIPKSTVPHFSPEFLIIMVKSQLTGIERAFNSLNFTEVVKPYPRTLDELNRQLVSSSK